MSEFPLPKVKKIFRTITAEYAVGGAKGTYIKTLMLEPEDQWDEFLGVAIGLRNGRPWSFKFRDHGMLWIEQKEREIEVVEGPSHIDLYVKSTEDEPLLR